MRRLSRPVHPRRHLAHDDSTSEPRAGPQIQHLRHDVRVLHGADNNHGHAHRLGYPADKRQDSNRSQHLRLRGRRTAFRRQRGFRTADRQSLSSE